MPRLFIAVVTTWPVAFLAYEYGAVATQAAFGGDCFILNLHTPIASYYTCAGWQHHHALAALTVLGLVVGTFGFLWVAIRWAIQPLTRITDAVSSLGPGSAGVRLAPRGWRRDEGTRLALAVDSMLDRFHHSYEAQRRFAANASHELRTPLATQRALVEVGLAAPLSGERSRLLAEQLLAANQRNEALVEGLLALAETDQGLIENAPQRLDQLVELVVDDYADLAAARGIDLRCELVPVTVIGEVALLERLVSNLVENAVKYNGADGWVSIHLAPPGRLTVTNTGPHVQPGRTGALFEPFRRSRGERLDHSSGAGLGLTIVRSIVAAHHGTVTARARPEGGLVVEVNLERSGP